MIRIVLETHSTTLDSEHGIATGWLDSPLAAVGQEQAGALGARRRDDVDAVFSSDLGRALQTAALAFEGARVPRFVDWRLRECNYGQLNGHAAAEVHRARAQHLERPFPGGESYHDVVARVDSFLGDLTPWDGQRLLVLGHSATRYALDHLLEHRPLLNAIEEPGTWQPGWEYVLER